MADDDPNKERYQLEGAVDVLFFLKEEFAQWAEEGQDDSKREALENVLAHIEQTEDEYRRRLAEARKRG
jgi:hypothetical protein